MILCFTFFANLDTCDSDTFIAKDISILDFFTDRNSKYSLSSSVKLHKFLNVSNSGTVKSYICIVNNHTIYLFFCYRFDSRIPTVLVTNGFKVPFKLHNGMFIRQTILHGNQSHGTISYHYCQNRLVPFK